MVTAHSYATEVREVFEAKSRTSLDVWSVLPDGLIEALYVFDVWLSGIHVYLLGVNRQEA